MKPLPTLIFPDTFIFSERLFPVLLFCAPLYYLQPVESDPEKPPEDEHDIFMKSGLCQVHTPSPLGENRDKFLRLIHDIQHRKDDYAAQLSSLTIAAMSQKSSKSDDEKRHQIVSSLLNSTSVEPQNTDESELDLWQARLVLAIAEILRQEEEELRQNLQILDEREMEMFRSLQGDGDSKEQNPLAELEQIAARLENARPREMKMRFSSWRKLMASAPIPDVSLWLASSEDGADQLVNEFDRVSSRTPVPILQLDLPDRIEASPRYVAEQILDFQKDSDEIKQTILDDLARLSLSEFDSPTSTDDLLPGSHDYVSTWNDQVAKHFPASSHGKASLVFYLLPGFPIKNLLFPDGNKNQTTTTHGLFSVMRRSGLKT